MNSCNGLARRQYGVFHVYWYIGQCVWPSFPLLFARNRDASLLPVIRILNLCQIVLLQQLCDLLSVPESVVDLAIRSLSHRRELDCAVG